MKAKDELLTVWTDKQYYPTAEQVRTQFECGTLVRVGVGVLILGRYMVQMSRPWYKRKMRNHFPSR